MLSRPETVRLVIFVTFLFVSAPRPSRSQSACIESLVLNATVCFWDASNHSSITSPAIVGVTVLPLLHPNHAVLFASFNGGPLVPLSAGAASVPVPPVDALQSCDSECNGHSTASGTLRCCSAVIDLWLVSNKSRSNIGCSLYFTIPAPAPPAALHPIIFKFHGEINAGLQRTRDAFRLCMSVLSFGSSFPAICIAAGANHFFSVISAPADFVRRACITLPPAPAAALGSQETVLANIFLAPQPALDCCVASSPCVPVSSHSTSVHTWSGDGPSPPPSFALYALLPAAAPVLLTALPRTRALLLPESAESIAVVISGGAPHSWKIYSGGDALLSGAYHACQPGSAPTDVPCAAHDAVAVLPLPVGQGRSASMTLHVNVDVDYGYSAGLADFGVADDDDEEAEAGDAAADAEQNVARSNAPSAVGDELRFERVGKGPASALQVRVFSVDLLLPPLPLLHPPLSCAHPLHWQGAWLLRSSISAHSASITRNSSALVDSKDAYAWLPSHCTSADLSPNNILLCLRERRRLFMAGSSQQRTLFFDLATAIGSTQNQPRKYWTNLNASDVDGILLAFHWMVPGYTSDGGLDYDTMLSALLQWLQSHRARDGDILLIQTGVHDIHLGDLAEYPANTLRLLRFLTVDAPVKLAVVFRSVDAVHVPRGGRSVVERGLRAPRVAAANCIMTVMLLHAFPDHVSAHVMLDRLEGLRCASGDKVCADAKDLARLRLMKRNGAGLTKQAVAAATNICIAGFASPAMRVMHLSAAALNPAPNPGTPFPLPLMLDTHEVTRARADMSRDGYHYFEQASEVTDAAGAEVCVGNSVARVVARLVLKSLCP